MKAPDDVKQPDWVQQVLGLRPKHPVRSKVNETHFPADFDKFLSALKNSKVFGNPFVRSKQWQKPMLKG